MKNMKTRKILLAMILLTVCSLYFTACDKKENSITDSTKKIVIGTSPDWPPFEYIDDSGQVDGFDIALVKEICERTGYELEIKKMEFVALIAAIETGSIDMVVSGMTITEDRKKSVDFTDVYFEAKQYIVVKQNSTIEKLSDLDGKKIAVQAGTTGDFIASGDEEMSVFVKNAKVSRFKKPVDAIMDLKNGQVDAVLIDSNVAINYVNENSDLRYIEEKDTVDNYAMAVKKGNTEVLQAFNQAIKDIKNDGTYQNLVDKYINQTK